MSSSPSALHRFVTRLSSRSTLTSEEIAAVLNLKNTAHDARANYDIVSPGQVVQESCLVAGGLVGRFEQLENGARQITALHIPGDMCDLHSVVMPKVQWRLQALTTTTYLRIPHSEVRSVAREYGALAEAFWRDCVVDAAIISQWVVTTGRRNAKSRLAHLLCEIGVRMEHAGAGTRTSYLFDVSQEHLGDMLALSAVHVNRTLQDIRTANLISSSGRYVTINDWDALAALGEFDPEYLGIVDQPLPRELMFAGAAR
jgi:CRP-like cAMP-binding protein